MSCEEIIAAKFVCPLGCSQLASNYIFGLTFFSSTPYEVTLGQLYKKQCTNARKGSEQDLWLAKSAPQHIAYLKVSDSPYNGHLHGVGQPVRWSVLLCIVLAGWELSSFKASVLWSSSKVSLAGEKLRHWV